MAGQDLLSKNLKILLRLGKSDATLEELAAYMKLPQGFLSIPLRVLKNEDLIMEEEGKYSLSKDSENSIYLVNLIEPWLDYKDNTYIEIAKDVAKIILKKSYDRAGVRDVLLFGSTIRNDRIPNDIDLLILHDRNKLAEFYDDPYGSNPEAIPESDQAIGNKNSRISAYNMLTKLGYRGLERNNLGFISYEDERELEKDSARNNILKRVEDIVGDVDKNCNWSVLDNLFDIHALSIRLLDKTNGTYSRENAIKSCRDPTFWHTVLSEGRIYDMAKHDFSIKVDDKYAGATELFKR